MVPLRLGTVIVAGWHLGEMLPAACDPSAQRCRWGHKRRRRRRRQWGLDQGHRNRLADVGRKAVVLAVDAVASRS
eukprot:6644550-Pyramimonas_sp.AAC.1